METFDFKIKTDEEMERLEIEAKELKTKLEFYEAVNSETYKEEIIEAKTRLEEIKNKKEKFSKIIGFPAYARIMTMSSSELELYKEEKIEELNKDISIAKIELKKEEKKKYELKRKQEELMESYSKTTDKYEKEKIISEAQRIDSDIRFLDTQKDGIMMIQSKLDQLQAEKEKIQKASDEEIKNIIASKIENFFECKSLYEKRKNELERPDRTDEFLASVSENNNKAIKLAGILEDYSRNYEALANQKYQAEYIQDSWFFSGLPARDYYGLKEGITFDTASEILAKYEADFVKVAKKFDPASMYKLSFIEKHADSDTVYLHSIDENIDFFKKNIEYIDSENLEILMDAYEEYSKLIGKHLFTKKKQSQKEKLEETISEVSRKMFEQIKKKYEENFDKFLMSGYSSFDSILYGEKSPYEIIGKTIFDIDKKIIEIKERIASDKKVFTDIYDKTAKRVEEANNKYIEAVGEEFKDIDINSLIAKIEKASRGLGYSNGINIESNKSKEKINKTKMLDEIVVDAQQESDKREAEITGMTLEELLEEKKKALEEKKNVGMSQEEISKLPTL